MTTLRGGVHRLARPEFDRGALDPSQTLHHVMIGFNRSAAQEQALQKLAAEQQDPASPKYHQWLTPEQFAAQFGMADADLAKVKDWLISRGFTIDEVARGRGYIAFSGAAGDINSAFRTELHQYAVNGELHFANATVPAVPTALFNVVSGIRGLNDFKPKARIRSHRIKPDFTSGLSGNTYVAPDDFATIYDLNALYAEGLDGTGQKIAVVGQTDLYSSGGDTVSDITTFRSVSNLPIKPPQVILVGSDTGISQADIGEASLDLEWSGAVARNATIIYVNASTQGGAFDALYYAIDDDVAPVISISYGLCEADEGSYAAMDENELETANIQGQAVVGPAGDTGAADCDYYNTYPAQLGLAVDFPGSSPYVVSVGGTTFNEGGGNYWSTVDDANDGSALFYIPETVWNDTSYDNGLEGTGGGVSVLFTKPSWQTGTGVPKDGYRDVPDVSFAASPNHDGFITCVEGDCQVCFPGATGEPADANCPTSTSPGYRLASDDTLHIVGGTSVGAPTFAGVLALVNQKMGSAQGTPNQRLYSLATSAPSAYHDITVGNNIVPCEVIAGDTGCTSGEMGYSAGVGYDQTTGLGSVDAYNLVSNWSATATADFSVLFFNPSITLSAGTSANAMVTLQSENGFSGSVDLSCSSNVPGVTCTVSPSVVSPNATATVAITASPSASLRTPAAPTPFAPWWTSAFGVAAFFTAGGLRKQNRKRQALAGLLMIILTMGFLSCGSSSRMSSPASISAQGRSSASAQHTYKLATNDATAQAAAPRQTPTSASITPSRPARGARPPAAAITVLATSGNLSHAAQIQVTVE